METILEKVKKWLASVRSEVPAFCKLCKVTVCLIAKTVKKRDVSAEKSAMPKLRAKTKNAQIAFGVIAALLVLFLFMRGCGSTTNGAMDIAETASIPRDTMRDTKPMSSDIHQTAQEIYNHRARNVIRELPFIRVRPKEGEVWQHDLPSITVIQVVDGGVLAITDRSSFDAGAQPAVIHVATWRSYADGDKLAIGFYRCTGRYSYTTTNGARKTVYSFEDLPSPLQQEIAAISIKERRAEFEENMRREKAEKEAKEAPKRRMMMHRIADYAERDQAFMKANAKEVERIKSNYSGAAQRFAIAEAYSDWEKDGMTDEKRANARRLESLRGKTKEQLLQEAIEKRKASMGQNAQN